MTCYSVALTPHWHANLYVLKYVSLTETKRPRVQQTATESSSSDEGHDVSVVYVCELPEVKGRFDIEKARKFFNRPGPHYGLLQSGQSVMASDGKTMVRLKSCLFFAWRSFISLRSQFFFSSIDSSLCFFCVVFHGRWWFSLSNNVSMNRAGAS